MEFDLRWHVRLADRSYMEKVAVRYVIAGMLLCGAAGCQKDSRMSISLAESPFNPEAPQTYSLYPGDVLDIRFPFDAHLDFEAPVRTDGNISVPHIGDVSAAHRQPEELRAELVKRLTGYLNRPDVTVIVSKEAGRMTYLGGEVHRPGALALHPNQSLVQAIFQVGGLTAMANAGQILVLRHRAGKGTFVLQADLPRIIAGEDPDIRLEPRDVIHVPETAIARMGRFVDQYINRIIPRAAGFAFTTELSSQPVRIVGDSAASVPNVVIAR